MGHNSSSQTVRLPEGSSLHSSHSQINDYLVPYLPSGKVTELVAQSQLGSMVRPFDTQSFAAANPNRSEILSNGLQT